MATMAPRINTAQKKAPLYPGGVNPAIPAVGATATRQARLQAANPTRFPKPVPTANPTPTVINNGVASNPPETGGGSTVGGTLGNAAAGTTTQPAAASPDKNAAAIAHLQNNIQKFGAANRPNDVKRLQALQSAGASPIPETPPTTTTNQPAADPNAAENEANALFPSERAMEPENYTGSPLYQWQEQQGNKALDRILAKRGLQNSGAEIQAKSDFESQLAGNEADKARGQAETEADRLERIQQNASVRQDQRSDAASNNAYRWTDLMLGQSPMNMAYDATGKTANITGQNSQAIANYLKNAYAKVHAVTQSSPGFRAPFPSSPDFSNVNTIASLTNSNSNDNFFNSFIKSLPSLFG